MSRSPWSVVSCFLSHSCRAQSTMVCMEVSKRVAANFVRLMSVGLNRTVNVTEVSASGCPSGFFFLLIRTALLLDREEIMPACKHRVKQSSRTCLLAASRSELWMSLDFQSCVQVVCARLAAAPQRL